MTFEQTFIPGVWIVSLERRDDNRGFFARSFCEREFASHGLLTRFPQCNISFNRKRGTLRGMHFQREPMAEAKLVRCTKGAVYDVVVDLRKQSPTYLRWFGIELTDENRQALYIAAGCAHGFQTLADNAELFYQMSEFYDAAAGDGVRWNDPAFGIKWPLTDPLLSERDATYPDFAR
jgi:dTDP-4-dehydrorhamnose 3,5-epimerase